MPQLDNREPARHPREREARQLALIHRIARIVAENLTVRARLQQIVRLLQEHLHCEFVACASIDLRSGRFRCEALATDIPSVIMWATVATWAAAWSAKSPRAARRSTSPM
jgi:hypothetical protein